MAHHCFTPQRYGSPAAKVGSVWRCDCGRRWQVIKRHGGYGPASLAWVRRFLPWAPIGG